MKFAVIGLGSFGGHFAKTLYENGHEVLAVDRNRDRIEEMKTYVSHAVSMEAPVRENLEALDLEEMDVVVVSLGSDMEASILTVLYLHEMKVKRIVAKALSEDHLKILEAVGAAEVIYPERDMAIKTALVLSNPNILDYIPLPSGFSIQEIAPPDKFIGKSLRELDLRNKSGILVVAIRELVPEKIHLSPPADFVIKDSDILVILGEDVQLSKLAKGH